MASRALARSVNLARGVVRDGRLYPALRARARTERSPRQALIELGFAAERIDALDRQYESQRAEVFTEMLAKARARDAELPMRKLADPTLPAHEAKRLLYLAVRLVEPEVVVETGTFNGTFSTFILLALENNAKGKLVSHDLPAREAIPHAIDHPLPAGADPGWIVPDRLRSRFELVLGDARQTLPQSLEQLGEIEMFFHDSLHTARHMSFEYHEAWPRLVDGGLLLSDDAFMTPAFWWFTRRKRIPLLHVGAVGITRKGAG